MKCVIIDDEPLAIKVIEEYLRKVEEIELVSKFTNSVKALDFLKSNEVDLVFLDIQMPNLSGLDLVNLIEKMPQFIFTTAYSDYAIKGFDLNAIDYLVKPIHFTRFIQAVNKAKENYNIIKSTKEYALLKKNSVNPDNFIFVRSEYDNIKINIENIKYIQGLKDYLKIYVDGSDKSILTLSNFQKILSKLPANKFLRVHRSYIVNIAKIELLRKSMLIVDGIRIPIGESYKENVFNRLNIE